MQKSVVYYDCLLQKEIYLSLLEIENSHDKKMFCFFAFDSFHEGVSTMAYRIKDILGRGRKKFKDRVYYNEKYYRNLYPESVSMLTDSDLRKYLDDMWLKYKIFCQNKISLSLQWECRVFLANVLKRIENYNLLYTIDTDKDVCLFLNKPKKHKVFYEFTFKKICSSGEKPQLVSVLYHSLPSFAFESYVERPPFEMFNHKPIGRSDSIQTIYLKDFISQGEKCFDAAFHKREYTWTDDFFLYRR